MYENRDYTSRPIQQQGLPMPKHAHDSQADFGRRLAELRKLAGFTQQELANEIGVTRRMIAYYEAESEHPPANLLVDLAKALCLSADELLGIKATKKTATKSDGRLQRRIQQIEKLPPQSKRQLIQVIDTFIKANKM